MHVLLFKIKLCKDSMKMAWINISVLVGGVLAPLIYERVMSKSVHDCYVSNVILNYINYSVMGRLIQLYLVPTRLSGLLFLD